MLRSFVLVVVATAAVSGVIVGVGTPGDVAGVDVPGGDALVAALEDDSDDGSGETTGANRTVRLETEIAERVNEARQENGLPALSADSELSQVARYHSTDMATRRYFDHVSPGGETPPDRYRKFGLTCRGGENIFKTTYSTAQTIDEVAERAVQSWLESEGHRENIMKQKYSRQGVGVNISHSGEMTYVYVTQNFC